MLDWSRAARRRGTIALILGLLATLILASIGTSPGASAAPGLGAATLDFQNEARGSFDLDSRGDAIAPSQAQRQAVDALGAHATWNEFGTPASLSRPSGFLATGLKGDAATAARAWLLANRGLFRLSEQDVSSVAPRTTPSRATPRPAVGSAGRRRSPRATTPTRSPGQTGSRRSPTCTCGSRRPARSTRPASTATST